MGTPASWAMAKPPFLKGPSFPERVRVPSGKITTVLPPRIWAAASWMLWMARSRLPRSMKMVPPRPAAQPTSGTHFSSFLEM